MLLNNGVELLPMGAGTWMPRDETARQNVRMALEAGFRHIDTAQGYENEKEVGQGIRDSSIPRQEMFVTTKVNTSTMRDGPQTVGDSIAESMAKFRTEHIDLLLIHWPVKDCVRHTWQLTEEYVRRGNGQEYRGERLQPTPPGRPAGIRRDSSCRPSASTGSSWAIVDTEDMLGVNLNIKPKR